MAKKIILLVAAGLLALSSLTAVFAHPGHGHGTNNGQKGYEGQPGNQGNPGGKGN